MSRNQNMSATSESDQGQWKEVSKSKRARPVYSPKKATEQPVRRNTELSPSKFSPTKNTSPGNRYSPSKSPRFPNVSKKPEEKNPFVERSEEISRVDQKIIEKAVSEPISVEELDAMIQRVCEEYDCSPGDWFAITEAHNLIYDERLKSHKISGFYSVPIKLNPSFGDDPNQVEELKLLPTPLALVCEWKTSTGVWKMDIIRDSEGCSVVHTVQAYCRMISSLHKTDVFASSIRGKEEEANRVFQSLFSSSPTKRFQPMKNNDHEFEVKNNVAQKKISEIIRQYNELHPIWSIIRLTPEEVANPKLITVPFIRDSNKLAINDINLNLKETKDNKIQGIYTIDPDFSTGYLPCLLLELVRGGLSPNYKAITFSKTIPMNNSKYYLGYRARILTKTANSALLEEGKKYLETEFLTNRKDLGKCVVRISIPRKN